jgi:hypothetical protein
LIIGAGSSSQQPDGALGELHQQCKRLLRFVNTAIFWFATDNSNIDYGYGSAVFVAWEPVDYGKDDLLDVLQGPQEPPSASTEECFF